MGFDMQQAETYLQSLQLIPLFKALGWSTPTEGVAIATRAFNQPYRAHCIAQRETGRVWEIKLNCPENLTTQLKTRLFQSISKKYPQPLLIFIDRQRRRSLWYWQSPLNTPQSLVFISQQPLGGWQPRLDYLATYQSASGALNLHPQPIHSNALTQQLRQQLQQLSDGITGISNVADRQWYAAVLLQRLMLVQLLQQRGFLNNDIWYLHNQLGHSQQHQQNSFFSHVLQPLFTQGFSLPSLERPRRISSQIGEIPYLGNVFYTHALEQQYTNIGVADAPFESILVWFESSLWQQVSNCWQASTVALAFEQVMTEASWQDPTVSEDDRNISSNRSITPITPYCDLILNQCMLRQLGVEPDPALPDLWDMLFYGDLDHLRQLVQTVLPQFSILDPACGAGVLLIALQHQLVDIYSVLIGHLTYCADSQLNIWLQGFQSEYSSILQTIYRRVFKHGLYGVDINPAVVDIARLQLLLGLVAIAQNPQDLEPLPSLDFNIVMGNSLVGFIRVDEAGFDRIRANETLLQGNLLQPLVAESYRSILAEKNITLEHYRSQSCVWEELQQGIPHYAQLEFFREHINRLDDKAQAKLNELLLVEFSQTLGIHFKESQLMDTPQRRLLLIEDLEVLEPFHWGYHFNHVLNHQGGFSVIVSRPPQGPFRPTTQEFFQRFRDLASRKNINWRTFKTAKSSLLNIDPDLANAWLFYQSQYSFVTDYFYRSPQYDHQSPLLKGKRQRTQLRQHWLFIERCFNLLSPRGICGLLVSNDIRDSPRSVALRSLLDHHTRVSSTMGLSEIPSLTDQCFLWFGKDSSE